MKNKQNEDLKTGVSPKSEKTPLADAVKKYKEYSRISFHVPGHKSAETFTRLRSYFGSEVLDADLTELPGLDDLHHPSGVIAEAERLAAEVFGAEETFFLVNGTTSGMTAAIAAAATEENTVILERQSHESTSRGLVLSGAAPCYLYNSFDQKRGLFSGISCEDVKNALQRCHSPAAVVLTHPSYYGTYSDLRTITEVAHQAGAVVIVDEAHGAQLAFTEQQGIPSALEAGADIVVQSTHKMLGSLTQSSMLHVQGTLADRNRLRYYISFMNSTSPSYLLMSSLDLARAFAAKQGGILWKRISAMIRETGDRLNQLDGIDCPRTFTGSDGQNYELENSRLLISAWEHGLTGMELSRILTSEYGIDMEFSDLRYTVALAGIGSIEADFEQLIHAMAEISKQPPGVIDTVVLEQQIQYQEAHWFRPAPGMTPRQAVSARILRLGGSHAEGMVSARDISLYPPGIPVIRAGEILSRGIITCIEKARQYGMQLHGTAGVGDDGKVRFFCAEDPRAYDLMNGFF